MNNEEKLAAYDATLEMLKATGKTMQAMKSSGILSESGIGSLSRIYSTIEWLEGKFE